MSNYTQHKPDITRIPKSLQSLDWVQMESSQIALSDGMEILVAVPVCQLKPFSLRKSRWKYSIEVVVIECDEHFLNLNCPGGSDWGWTLSDVDFYVTINE